MPISKRGSDLPKVEQEPVTIITHSLVTTEIIRCVRERCVRGEREVCEGGRGREATN